MNNKKYINILPFGKVLLGFFALVFVTPASAQDEIECNASADIVSNYIWRGGKLDDAAVQPTLGLSYKRLSLSAWGSYGITGSEDITKEIDLTLAYTIGGFNIGVTDYWSEGAAALVDGRYFKYGSGSEHTGHTFEANVGYDFGPISLQWYTNFAGVDGLTEKGQRAYTSYVEANAPFRLGGIDWTGTIGAVPYSANNGFYAANSDGFAVTNIALKASKDIKITESFKIPVFAQIATNPSTQKAFFVFGFTLQPFQ